jgi:formate dehydrogenase major subunit
MQITRRQFLKSSSAALAGGLTLSALGIDVTPVRAYTSGLEKMEKIRNSTLSTTTCCYCSCGCGLICSTDENGKVINIEGDPDHPINEGALCAKGMNLKETGADNPHRLRKVLYRAPYSAEWEEKEWDWALDRMARKIKDVRDADFMTTNSKGQTVNRIESLAFHGSSNVNNEECFMMYEFARSLGLVYVDHQARV